MTELRYKFTNDTLFKILFVEYPDLLKKLVAALLGIPAESIERFEIANPEIPPEIFGDKFCRLDINMTVDSQRVDLEIQVADEGDYPERSLYYWAREYSSALPQGGDYADLPRTVVISIVAFRMFDSVEYHSEFQPLEVTRHTPLTDKQSLHYFELPKLPKEVGVLNGLDLWLALFNAKTEEDLAKIEALGVPEMTQTIQAYRAVTVTDSFRELERLRFLAKCNETSALRHAANTAAAAERAKWQGVVEAERAKAGAERAKAEAERAKAEAERAKLHSVVEDKDAEIARLRAALDGSGKQ